LLDTGRVHSIEFGLPGFHKYIHNFAFIPGYQQHKFEGQDPINIEAVQIMGNLHDALEQGGYTGHQLERFLVRILFCLFAEDTGIFDSEAFRLYLINRTAEDGSDLGPRLARLFEVLNTPKEKRQKNLDEMLADLPYVNGDLFAETLGFADFNLQMRMALVYCTGFDWSRISPAIFGSLFQAVMEPRERRQIGGHYTNERDILKVIRSLFLDDLRAEFERAKGSKAELKRFHEKLAGLRFLDPACGCGNFLVITYRELRLLEIDLLKELYKGSDQQELDIQRLSLVDVDQFYGIEISEWPARIAEVAMWLMDHQMNNRLSEAFGQYFVRLPLKKSPTIKHGNALRLDWKEILPPEKCSYVLGNPPFVGKHLMTPDQEKDMQLVWGNTNGSGFLDYVTGWYLKAAQYIAGTNTPVGFVSTNSISQGEQVGILWNELFQKYQIKIHFAHRTFQWESEARGKAHVHVVIIGFGAYDKTNKLIYDYESENATVSPVRNISPYLIEGPDVALPIRRDALCPVPEIINGNKPSDGGFLIMEEPEREPFLKENPAAEPFLRSYVSAEEFINGSRRWVLWLKDAAPDVIRNSPGIVERLEKVRDFRLQSRKIPTRLKAATPSLFDQVRQPSTSYLVIPKTSSERRRYIPIAVVGPEIIASTELQMIPDFTTYHFGVLTSAIHMAWMRQVCGRLKSDYRYSNKLVYNNFPWPESPTAKQRAAVETAAQAVLDARKQFPEASLAELYDPLSMPPALVKAHGQLDRAVDLCYRPQPFENDRQRVEYLFALYEKLTAPLIPHPPKRRRKAATN
jgi:restriction-modification enzyme MmeI-like protein